ncbi:MAG TPA: Rieske (2Fe-2S) protein [Acidimicrobiales bacterium]|jgi:ubiquinol-cytochrome c reductase iron-sulfur subunit|nr:Rieske (2Fe-2S) protein [Acidimicrobiales bacterium]
MKATTDRDGTGLVLVALVVATLSALAVTVVYALGGQPQLEGALLGLALGGVALALVLFARRLLPHGHFVQVRDEHPEAAVERAGVASAFQSGAEPIERRSLIAKFFGAAVVALGLAALFPIRSLGTRPGRTLVHTHWKRGTRVVTPDGQAVRLQDVDVNTVLTVFPQDHPDEADSQAVLIRLPLNVEVPGPAGSTVGGVVAFSKICTHAGCPVGLYQADTQELFCPCHQSTFSVPEGCKPTFGPATRPLPQLPIGVDGEGFVVAMGDFPEPVGPGYWSRPSA